MEGFKMYALLLFPLFCMGQINVKYADIPKKEGRYGTYVTKSGQTIALRDSLTIGMPTGPNGFRFINVGKFSASNVIAGRKVGVERIRTFRRGRLRGKVFVEANSYGLMRPFRIDYEMALKSGEIVAPEQNQSNGH
ncbi:hypothetical protein [Maribacter sp. 2307ULW6-5]|uniref:hypothetical protein n=1 Tax=Maribacter sp. 2307ULW6-5 TaxID=3386275 RepID=UPI0039BD675C